MGECLPRTQKALSLIPTYLKKNQIKKNKKQKQKESLCSSASCGLFLRCDNLKENSPMGSYV